MRSIVIVNELTVSWLLLNVWFGGRPEILIVDPLLPPLGRLLERATRWAEAQGARRLIDRFPQHREAWEYPTLILGHDVLNRIEPWQNEAYRLDTTASTDDRYGGAFKLLATMYLFRRYMAAFLLVQALRQADDIRVRGVSSALYGVATAWFGPTSLPGIRPQRLPARLVNAPLMLAGLLASLAFITRRIRASVTPETVFMMADFNNDPRDFALYERMADQGPIVLLMRNADIQSRALQGAESYAQYLPGDGGFSLMGALEAATMAIGDSARQFLNYGWSEPGLFWQAALLPYRRAVVRSLLNAVRPRFFWSRDDYNVEHVIRRQELNALGSKQFGLNHAIQGITIVMPQMRHVSMDAYFTMGSAFHPYYLKTWNVGSLHSIGGFAFSEEYLARPRRTSRAILFMARFAVGNQEFARAVRGTAKAFPDRTILLQVKRGYPHEVAIPDFISACTEGVSNVEYTTTPVYDLILTADMVVSDASTVIAELIELGTPVLMLDVLENHLQSIYRQFPGLTVRTAKETIATLRGWDSGELIFDRMAFKDLINLDSPLFTDVIRAEMIGENT